jgi:segregation and condensation protein B
MSKRKKNKHHAKNKKGAKGTVESANATEVVADVSEPEVDTSVVESAEAEGAAEADPATPPSDVTESEAAPIEQAAPSELASDVLEPEAEADANGAVEEPKADAVSDVNESVAETGKGKRKSKKGKKAAKNEATTATSDQPSASAEEKTDGEPATVSEPTSEAAGSGEVTAQDEGVASETGDAEGTTESALEDVEPEASAREQNESAEAAVNAESGAPAEGESQGSDGESQDDGAGEGEEVSEAPADPNALEGDRLESIIESLLFASDKALSLSDLKRLLGDRDGKKINAAVQSLIQKRMDTGIQVVTLSTGWHLRTSVDNAEWVSKLLVGKPVRLSRAMMETLAIVAYRQPVTRPEVDDIRGVDCGAVLKTLLDRGLVRIIGKKEEVGRPMLYGTTQEFLRVFNLRDLTELPTLREFYDLSAEDQSKVDAEAPQTPSATTAKPDVALNSVARGALAPEEEDTDPLLDELDEASKLAKKALGEMEPDKSEQDKEEEKAEGAQSEAAAHNEPESTPAGE